MAGVSTGVPIAGSERMSGHGRFIWSENEIEVLAPAKRELSELEWVAVFREIAAKFTGGTQETVIDGAADGQPASG